MSVMVSTLPVREIRRGVPSSMPARVIGREAEMSQAIVMLRRLSRSRRGAAMLVSGEPGIGKSAFVQAVAEQASRLGCRVGVALAEATDIAPGAPLLMALRSGTEPLLDNEAFTELGALYREPLWLVNRLASLLEVISREAPIVIVVDDADLSDDLTRYAIRTLSGRLAGSPVLWLLAGRDPGEGELVGLVGGARRSRTEHIRLAPLGAASMEELLVEQLGQPDAEVSGLLDKVGGNPFWARRVLDGYASDRSTELGGVPAQFVESVRQRLLSLAPPAFALVQAAAVWNHRFGVDEAAELLGDADSGGVMRSLAGAVDVGLLAESRTGFWFPHELVRQAVYLDVPPSSRRSLHRAFGRHLLAGGHGPITATAHFVASAEPGDLECVEVLRAAAVGSEPHTAADLLAQAWELTPSDHPRWIEIGEACLTATSHGGTRTRSQLDRSRAPGCCQVSTRTRRLACRSCAAQADWLTGRVDDTAARLATVLDDPSTGQALRARVAAAQALTLTELGRMDEAAATADEALSAGPHRSGPVDRRRRTESAGQGGVVRGTVRGRTGPVQGRTRSHAARGSD